MYFLEIRKFVEQNTTFTEQGLVTTMQVFISDRREMNFFNEYTNGRNHFSLILRVDF